MSNFKGCCSYGENIPTEFNEYFNVQGFPLCFYRDFFLCGNLQASPLSKGVAVISSRYKPYLDILDGIKESVKIPVDAIYLEDGSEIAVSKINDKSYDFAIGIGLQSYEFLKKQTKNIKLFYSLLVYEDKNNCGV